MELVEFKDNAYSIDKFFNLYIDSGTWILKLKKSINVAKK